MLCAIWYHLYNLKNVKNTHGGVLLLVKLQASLKVTLLHGCFSRFLNCTNDTNRAMHYKDGAFPPYQHLWRNIHTWISPFTKGGGWVFLILPKKGVVLKLFSYKGVALLNREVVLKRGEIWLQWWRFLLIVLLSMKNLFHVSSSHSSHSSCFLVWEIYWFTPFLSAFFVFLRSPLPATVLFAKIVNGF